MSSERIKVAVLGAAGGIGQPLSLLIQMDPNVDEVALFDVVSDKTCKSLRTLYYPSPISNKRAFHRSKFQRHTTGIATELNHLDTTAKVSGGYLGNVNLT